MKDKAKGEMKDKAKGATDEGKRTQSSSAKAGLIMPVPRVAGRIKARGGTKRTAKTAAVYMAGVLEFVAEEIIDASIASLGKRKRINHTDIVKAIRGDNELNKLYGSYAFVSADSVNRRAKKKKVEE
jgi:histone H2A